MTDNKLKSIVERVERLKEEQKALGADVRDIFAEAKSGGYNPKVLRRIIARRAKDAAEVAAEEAEMDAYMVALGMAVDLVNSGLSLREAAKRTGTSKSSVHRALAVPAASQEPVPHNPETGEIENTAEATASRSETHAGQLRAGRMPDEQVSAANSGSYLKESGAPNLARDCAGTAETTSSPAPAVAAFDADRDMPASLRRIPSRVSA